MWTSAGFVLLLHYTYDVALNIIEMCCAVQSAAMRSLVQTHVGNSWLASYDTTYRVSQEDVALATMHNKHASTHIPILSMVGVVIEPSREARTPSYAGGGHGGAGEDVHGGLSGSGVDADGANTETDDDVVLTPQNFKAILDLSKAIASRAAVPSPRPFGKFGRTAQHVSLFNATWRDGARPVVLMIDKDAAALLACLVYSVVEATKPAVIEELRSICTALVAGLQQPSTTEMQAYEAFLRDPTSASSTASHVDADTLPISTRRVCEETFEAGFARHRRDLAAAALQTLHDDMHAAIRALAKATTWAGAEEATRRVNRHFCVLAQEGRAFKFCRRYFYIYVRLCWFHVKQAIVRKLRATVPAEFIRVTVAPLIDVMLQQRTDEALDAWWTNFQFVLTRDGGAQNVAGAGEVVRYMKTCWMHPKWRNLWSLPGRIGLSMMLTYTTNDVELFHNILKRFYLNGRKGADIIAVLRVLTGGPYATADEVARSYVNRLRLQLHGASPDNKVSVRPMRRRVREMRLRIQGVFAARVIVPFGRPGCYTLTSTSLSSPDTDEAVDVQDTNEASQGGMPEDDDGDADEDAEAQAALLEAAEQRRGPPMRGHVVTVSLSPSFCSLCRRALCKHVLAVRLYHLSCGLARMWPDYEEAAYRPDNSITPLGRGLDGTAVAVRGTVSRAGPRPIRARSAPELKRGIADLAAEFRATLESFHARALRALDVLVGNDADHDDEDDDDDDGVDALARRFRLLSRVTEKLSASDNANAAITGEIQTVYASKIERRVQSQADYASLPAQRTVVVPRTLLREESLAATPSAPSVVGGPAVSRSLVGQKRHV